MGLFDFIKKATDPRNYIRNSPWPSDFSGGFYVELFHTHNIKPTNTLDEYLQQQREYWGDRRIKSYGAWSWNGEDEWREAMVSSWKRQHMVLPSSSWFDFMKGDLITIELIKIFDYSHTYSAQIINKSNIDRLNQSSKFLKSNCKHPNSKFIVERFIPLAGQSFESKIKTIALLSRDVGIYQGQRLVEHDIYINCTIRFNNTYIDITSNMVEGPIYGVRFKSDCI